MIAYIHGKVVDVNAVDGEIIVEAGQSGVGYRLLVTQPLAETTLVNDELTLHVSTQVREDAITLYGFKTQDERLVFRKLIDISKLGPKLALAILSMYSPAQIQAIGNANDVNSLAQVSGIGKKKAATFVIEIASKLANCAFMDGESTMTLTRPQAATPKRAHADAREALVSLGFSEKEIDAAISALDQSGESLPLTDEIRWLLQYLNS